MAKRKKVDFNLASEIFEDASLADNLEKEVEFQKKSYVPIKKLQTNPYQPRMEIDYSSVEELAESIKENGLLQPITVLKNEDESYTIIFGHRRVAAYEYLGLEEIEANILDSIENKDMILSPVVENLQRKDMEPIETALALDKILKMGVVKTQMELAKKIGISQGRISKILSVLKLSNKVLEEIKKDNYKDVTVLALLNRVDLDSQLEVYVNIKSLQRNEALAYIKNYLNNAKISNNTKVVYGNNSYKINTKGLKKETKEKIREHIKQIEELILKDSHE